MRLLISASLLSVLSFSSAQPQVLLGKTTIVGAALAQGQDFFGAIPYAVPPIGPLRFTPPQLMRYPQTTTLNASDFGPSCLKPKVEVGQPNAEDCLTLNIFRPAGIQSNASLPVMIYIFGGGFLNGAAASFNGSHLVNASMKRGTPVIYVNLNYRLGPLGFPQGSEAAANNALNLGLQDQLTALEWLHLNINTFGGDGTKMTVFGQSAGAISIGLLFLNSGIENYVRGAIFESGFAGTTPIFSPTRQEVDWQNFVAAVPSCANLALTTNTFECMQAADETDIVYAIASATNSSGVQYPWTPVLDGSSGVIPNLPSVSWSSGQFSRLPFIAGTNQDDGTVFTPQDTNSISEVYLTFYNASIPSPSGPDNLAIGDTLKDLIDMYPNIPADGSPFGTGNNTFGLDPEYKVLAAISTDLEFSALRRNWIQVASNFSVKAYGCLFVDPNAVVPGGVTPTPAPGSLGVAHMSEIPYVYGDPPSKTSSETLSTQMMDYWLSFVTTLDPNDGIGSTRPTWSPYTPQSQLVMQLNGSHSLMIADNYRADQMSYINEHAATWSH